MDGRRNDFRRGIRYHSALRRLFCDPRCSVLDHRSSRKQNKKLLATAQELLVSGNVPPTVDSARPEERLKAWLDDVHVSARAEHPQYRNPSELKADLRILLAALAAQARQLQEERTLREQIEDDHWPYEWQVATAERERRKTAEHQLQEAREAAIRHNNAIDGYDGGLSEHGPCLICDWLEEDAALSSARPSHDCADHAVTADEGTSFCARCVEESAQPAERMAVLQQALDLLDAIIEDGKDDETFLRYEAVAARSSLLRALWMRRAPCTRCSGKGVTGISWCGACRGGWVEVTVPAQPGETG